MSFDVFIGNTTNRGIGVMTPADQYRMKAAELDAAARCETSARLKAEFEHLARAYRRLAEQAERNGRTDVVYETPTPKEGYGKPPEQ